MENRWNYMDVGKTCLSATSSITNSTRNGLGLDNGLRVNGHLILGTDFFLIRLRNEGRRKVFPCLITYHDMNSYGGGGGEEYLYAFLVLVLDGEVQSAVWPGWFRRGAVDPGAQ